MAFMTFVSGIEPSRRFHARVVAPLVGEPYSAALLGPGSEVLGFDTARSADHDWTARLQLFLPRVRDIPVPATFPGYPAKLVVATLGDWTRGALGFDPASTDRRDRERHLVAAYETVAEAHNALGLTAPVDPRTSDYHDRPFRVIHADRFVEPLLAGLTDPRLRSPLGAVEQYLDSTDVLGDRAVTRAVVDCSHG
jgi:hypothetical protein